MSFLMRIWTLHPQYLDPQGLVALWRESLLARAVLRGKTKGYRHHPQLHRFLEQAAPVTAINSYLAGVLAEAGSRGYSFDSTKVGPIRSRVSLASTDGQLQYEWQHLLHKLRMRSPAHHRRLRGITRPEPHPLFRISPGPTETWERVSTTKRNR
jgi:Pyrimidine dimer DNA glycosylase